MIVLHHYHAGGQLRTNCWRKWFSPNILRYLWWFMFHGFAERRFNIANLIWSDINDLIVSVHGHKYDINYMLLIYSTNTGMHIFCICNYTDSSFIFLYVTANQYVWRLRVFQIWINCNKFCDQCISFKTVFESKDLVQLL